MFRHFPIMLCATAVLLTSLVGCTDDELTREKAFSLIEEELLKGELFTGTLGIDPLLIMIWRGSNPSEANARKEIIPLVRSKFGALSFQLNPELVSSWTLLSGKISKLGYSEYYFYPELTPKALEYVVKQEPVYLNGSEIMTSNVLTLKVVEPKLEEVTGIATLGEKAVAEATFQVTLEQTPFIEERVFSMPLSSRYNQHGKGEELLGTHTGAATFVQYDDGWRLKDINLNSAMLK